MKSTNLKNWRYDLSYNEIASLEDFGSVLTDAIANDICLLCGGNRVSKDGLCIGCGMSLSGLDKAASELVRDSVKVRIEVTLSDVFAKNLGERLLMV